MQTISLGPPPDNDECANATVFIAGSTEVFSNVNWVTDGLQEPALCGADGQVYGDGWYELIATCDGVVKLTVEGDFAARILVYTGDCNDLTAIACSGSTGCAGSSAVVTFSASAGETFFVRVGGCTEADAGVASLSADCQLPSAVPAMPVAGLFLLGALLLVAGASALRLRGC